MLFLKKTKQTTLLHETFMNSQKQQVNFILNIKASIKEYVHVYSILNITVADVCSAVDQTFMLVFQKNPKNRNNIKVALDK